MSAFAICAWCAGEFSVNHNDRMRGHDDGNGAWCAGAAALIPRGQQHPQRTLPYRRRPGSSSNPNQAASNESRAANLRTGNEKRTTAAARRDIEYAGKLLANGALDERATAIALTRVEHPGWSWRRIGDHLDMTKDQVVSVFRRRCQTAGLRVSSRNGR